MRFRWLMTCKQYVALSGARLANGSAPSYHEGDGDTKLYRHASHYIIFTVFVIEAPFVNTNSENALKLEGKNRHFYAYTVEYGVFKNAIGHIM